MSAKPTEVKQVNAIRIYRLNHRRPAAVFGLSVQCSNITTNKSYPVRTGLLKQIYLMIVLISSKH